MVKIMKQLAGVQDLMVGNDTLTQVRNGQEVLVTGVSGDSLPIAEADGVTIRQAILDRYTKSEADNKYSETDNKYNMLASNFPLGRRGWSTPSPARVTGVPFTNNTSKLRIVQVGMPTGPSVYNAITGKVDGVVQQQYQGPGDGSIIVSITLFVPPGSTYKVEAFLDSYTFWRELDI